MSTILLHVVRPSANLECRSEMCCMRLAGPKKSPKIPRLRTISQLCPAISSQLRHVGYRQSEKLVKQQHVLQMSSQYGELRPATNDAGRTSFSEVELVLSPSESIYIAANFNGFRVLPSLLQWRRSPERRPTKLCPMFGRLLGCYTIYIFWGSCPLTKFCPVQNSVCVQVLHCPILAALLHGTPAAGVSQTLLRGRDLTRNGITELSQRAAPIFGRAAITLGIGPHSI